MSVKRYWKDTGQVSSEVGEHSEGDYIRYEDYVALENRSMALDGLLDGIELIAVNDKSGCQCCSLIVQAIVAERPTKAKPQGDT